MIYGKKGKLPIFFVKRAQPSWLCELGEAQLNGVGTWELVIPDFLVAHVAGHNSTLEREFIVSVNSDLFQELFSLINY